MESNRFLTIAYMNIHGQTGLDESKQVQIEQFIKSYNVDILNCQEINILEETFRNCNLIASSYEIIQNNDANKYGTCCIVSSSLETDNIKLDTNGRIISFDIEDFTFCNVYLPSGNDSLMKNNRENYIAEILPQILVNAKYSGCVGGDWNCITEAIDASKNPNNKISNSLRRVIKTFDWTDSYRWQHPGAQHYSRYYSNSVHGEGASRIDRVYHFGSIDIVETKYVGVAFSDHLSLILKIKLPDSISKLKSPKHKPLFKANPDVVQDKIFQDKLRKSFKIWSEVRNNTCMKILDWWEIVVKPLVKKLIIERSREINKERLGKLNLLQIRQAYLIRKMQLGHMECLAELHLVQSKIVEWHKLACDKIKLIAKCEEIDSNENVRIYHHELHKKRIKRNSILKLEVDSKIYSGHNECAKLLEDSVGQLLLSPPELDPLAQQELLKEIKPVFNCDDNAMLAKVPSKDEVKNSISNSNLHAAPGTDGLTSFFYNHCWDIIGDALTEVVIEVHKGSRPTLSQRTSLMVFGSKPKKPKSTKPSDKRKISLLNADFKIITGIFNERLKKVADHTLSPCQLAVGSDRRIHHGINRARDAIVAASKSRVGMGLLDNDYMAAFDHMVLLWVLKVMRAKGLEENVIKHITNLYSNSFTIVVVNDVMGRRFENKHWSIRQGDRPSSILFCFGIDPHLTWLDSRLRGIDIYRMPVAGPTLTSESFPITISETYRVLGYIDDVKPAITSMNEFILVDEGSSLFEKASGCILHRSPSSGKVKFLPLGRWRGTLQQEDLPVPYVALSDHLDMVGVDLRATPTSTRKENGDILVDRVKKTIGGWKGGKFLPLCLRGIAVNTYCLSKVWFRCGSIDMKAGDIVKITSLIKSWIYADQLIKPEEIALYKARNFGGLKLINVKYRAMAELIKTFIDTAINPKYITNYFHQALFRWYVEEDRSIPDPGKSPYYSEDFFSFIRKVKEEGLLRLSSLKIRDWYRLLLEENILNVKDINGTLTKQLLKCERDQPDISWETVWSLCAVRGLESNDSSFLFRLLHCLLPTQERLFRIYGTKVGSNICPLCSTNNECSLVHAFVLCPFINQVGHWLITHLKPSMPNLTGQQLIRLNFPLELGSNEVFSVMWFSAKVLSLIWGSRMSKKQISIRTVRAKLEAEIMLLRKTRFANHVPMLEELMKDT